MAIEIVTWSGKDHHTRRTADINGPAIEGGFDAGVAGSRPESAVVELTDGTAYMVGHVYNAPATGDYVRLNGSPAPALRVKRVAYNTL